MNDWPDLIKGIESTGMTQQQIADAIPTSQGHISDLRSGRRGKRLSYDTARKLLALAASRGVSTHPEKDAA